MIRRHKRICLYTKSNWLRIFVGAFFIVFSTAIYSTPEGGTVTAGDATITQSGSNTTINQNSSHAIVNWNSFNIDKNEAVHFQQPTGPLSFTQSDSTITSENIGDSTQSNSITKSINPNNSAMYSKSFVGNKAFSSDDNIIPTVNITFPALLSIAILSNGNTASRGGSSPTPNILIEAKIGFKLNKVRNYYTVRNKIPKFRFFV